MSKASNTRERTETQVLGDVSTEIHRLRTADGADITVTRIPGRSVQNTCRPVILLHGTYSKRNFWISPRGIGLGPFLSGKGFDVWIPELRGHGLSPKGNHFPRITAEDQIRYDIPSIQAYVYKKTGHKTTWICHSFGGVYVLAALSRNWLGQDKIRGLLTFGSQISRGERFLKIPPLAWGCKWILRRIGYLPAPRLGLGPEIEPAEAMIEVIGWKALGGRWASRDGTSYWEGLSRITLPVFCFAAAADKNDPPEGCKILFDHLGSAEKTFILLGKKNGFRKDYDHIGMIVSKEAQDEVWPLTAGKILSF